LRGDTNTSNFVSVKSVKGLVVIIRVRTGNILLKTLNVCAEVM
jgi:hypothetical protein